MSAPAALQDAQQLDYVLMLGTFPFTLPQELAGGRRRALRTD